MKISINAVRAHCIVSYFQYFSQLMLELVATFFDFHWCLKETLLVFNLLLVLKQRFNELINGRSQANRDQKSNLLFLQRHVQSQKFRLKIAKNRQKALERD